jgi:hypothetical protein
MAFMDLDRFGRKLRRTLLRSEQKVERQKAAASAAGDGHSSRQRASQSSSRIMRDVVRPRLIEFAMQLGLLAAAQSLDEEMTLGGGAKYRCPITAAYSLAVTLEPDDDGQVDQLDLRIALYRDGHVADRPGIMTIVADDASEDDEIGAWIEYQLVKRVEECVRAKFG